MSLVSTCMGDHAWNNYSFTIVPMGPEISIELGDYE